MNVASLEPSKELYELSGWDDLQRAWLKGSPINGGDYVGFYHGEDYQKKLLIAPAYDLGYLLRKLPPEATIKRFKYPEVEGYEAEYNWIGEDGTGEGVSCGASIPEDAAAKLCIELIKQGILPKESK